MTGKIIDMNKVDVVVYLDNGSIINIGKWTLSPNIKLGDVINVSNPTFRNDKFIGFL